VGIRIRASNLRLSNFFPLILLRRAPAAAHADRAELAAVLCDGELHADAREDGRRRARIVGERFPFEREASLP
jgi:hypothetical protein